MIVQISGCKRLGIKVRESEESKKSRKIKKLRAYALSSGIMLYPL